MTIYHERMTVLSPPFHNRNVQLAVFLNSSHLSQLNLQGLNAFISLLLVTIIEDSLILIFEVKQRSVRENHHTNAQQENQGNKAGTGLKSFSAHVSNHADLKQKKPKLRVQQNLLEHFTARIYLLPVDCQKVVGINNMSHSKEHESSNTHHRHS